MGIFGKQGFRDRENRLVIEHIPNEERPVPFATRQEKRRFMAGAFVLAMGAGAMYDIAKQNEIIGCGADARGQEFVLQQRGSLFDSAVRAAFEIPSSKPRQPSFRDHVELNVSDDGTLRLSCTINHTTAVRHDPALDAEAERNAAAIRRARDEGYRRALNVTQ